uniref:DNA-directed DNA polymerase n=1 Tax=Percid herpesvirus 2 TaxID=2219644 RepID=A0A2U9QGN3_9VIRU|nr:DNA dependent DNA polymerase [Percid herpesvirus 2]
MDASSSLHRAVAHLLPARRCLTAAELAPYTFYYFSTVRFVESDNILLVRALDITTRLVSDLVISGLNFFAGVPSRVCSSAIQRLALSLTPTYTYTTRMFNSDRKHYEDFSMYVFAKYDQERTFVTLGNPMLSRQDDNVYTFGDHVTTMDGNTVALYNNVLCGHAYLAPDGVSMLLARDLVYDEARDTAALMKLSTFISHVRNEAAFDLETIVQESNIGPKYRCDRFNARYFQRYHAMQTHYATFKSTWPNVPMDRPPRDDVTMKPHEVTSVSLVIGNYHLAKPTRATHRKDLLVYYNVESIAVPALPIDTRDLGIDYDRVQFVPCNNEYDMLHSFLKRLMRSVDILYVYNANFDVSVLRQRIAYYNFRQRVSGCCLAHQQIDVTRGAKLQTLWENFLSKQPDLCPGQLVLGLDVCHQIYVSFLTDVTAIMQTPGLNANECRSRVSARKALYQTTKSHVQNLKSTCYGSDVVDMRLVVTQRAYDECNSGRLNDKAHVVITKFKPHKNPRKCQKLKDISYDQLDESYRAGGTRLTECLIYNLIDSHLLMRMAKCIEPLKDYVYRQVATYNIDQMVHTRGTMPFSGFIAPTKAVEVSRHKARLDLGSVVATGHLRNSMYAPETMQRRGGYVMQPQTGLSFSRPGASFETIVDFASLYPSIMCDLNISPETIVAHEHADKLTDYVAYDWSRIANGFSKYTLVLAVERSTDGVTPPRLTRHISDTCCSLKRYLGLRAHHKSCLRTSVTPLQRDYHNRLQNEMKICANSHYGTSDLTCSLMITTQGQHKIKLVNKQLLRLNMAPNYGDTDSTMFWSPADTSEKGFDGDCEPVFSAATEELRAYVVSKLTHELMARVKARFQTTQEFVSHFLHDIGAVLLNDVMAKMTLLTTNSQGERVLVPLVKDPVDGDWYARDHLTGTRMNASAAFRVDMVTKLEYENCSSVTCHVAKKMVSLSHTHSYVLLLLVVFVTNISTPSPQYVCLVHELSEDGTLTSTVIKKRGMTGFKTSRFGATETITRDFIDIIFKGHILSVTSDVDRLVPTSWSTVTTGQNVMCLSDNQPDLTLHRILATKTTSGGDGSNSGTLEYIFVKLRDEETDLVTTRCVCLHRGHNMDHVYSDTGARERELAFVKLSEFRTLSVAMGFLNWSHVIRYAKVAALKNEYKAKREAYKMFTTKQLKLPYVHLIDKKTRLYQILGRTASNMEFPNEWVKQDPAVAFFRRFPIDLKLETLMRDYFGSGFKCEVPGFTCAEPLDGMPWPRPQQLSVKSQIDSLYLNDNSKCLAHVLIDLHMWNVTRFDCNEAQLGAHMAEIVAVVVATKRRMQQLVELGLELFYTINGNAPPELVYRTDTTYDFEADCAMRPLTKAVRIPREHQQPEIIYATALAALRNDLTALEPFVRFAPLAVPFTERTLTVLPLRVATDLCLPPHVILTTDSTDEPVLLRAAQHIYYATLARHAMDGLNFSVHELPMTLLRGLPRRATPRELCAYFRGVKALCDSAEPLVAHCAHCLRFWSEVSVDSAVTDNFDFDGHFFRLRPGQCQCIFSPHTAL